MALPSVMRQMSLMTCGGVEVAVVRQRLDVADGRIALHRVDVLQPRPVVRRLDHVEQILQRLAQVRHDRGIGLDVLVDLGRIDVDVDLLRVDRVGLDVAGDAIVEPHAEREEQVGFLNRVVDPRLAVHAHHADVERMAGREAAEAEQRHRDRRVDALGELPHFLHRAALQDALPREDDRPLRLRESDRPPSAAPTAAPPACGR